MTEIGIFFGSDTGNTEKIAKMIQKELGGSKVAEVYDKQVALFGCGDQEDYAEYFCDAMGKLRDVIEVRGAVIVGHWSTSGYHFEASLALVDEEHFIGLAIDEDRQPELTSERVITWVKQISKELNLAV